MSKISNYQGYLFDFDGVIIDVNEIKGQGFAEIYRPAGEEVVRKVLEHHQMNLGANRLEKFRYCHRNFLNKTLSEGELASLSKKFSDYTTHKIIEAPLIAGVETFLAFLLNKNKKIFIASNAPEDEVRKIVSERKLRKYFLAVKGAPLSKNESVGQILQGYNLHASDCVLFGDTESDGQVAESFEIDFVPINYFDKSRGYANFTELMESQVYV